MLGNLQSQSILASQVTLIGHDSDHYRYLKLSFPSVFNGKVSSSKEASPLNSLGHIAVCGTRWDEPEGPEGTGHCV